MSRRLLVQVAADGTVTAETLGYTGQECFDSIAVLEDLLDATTVSSRFTDSYQSDRTPQNLQNHDDDELPAQH